MTPLPFLGDEPFLLPPKAALDRRADQLLEPAARQPEPTRPHGRIAPQRRLLDGISVEQKLLRVEADVVELRIELVARDELPALGQRVDDLLLARIVVAVKLHAKIVDPAQTPSSSGRRWS